MQPSILKKNFTELEIPEELKLFMKENSFSTLEAMLKYTAKELMNMKGFSFRMVYQLMEILHQHELMDALKET